MDALIAILQSPGPELLKFGPIVIRWYGLLIALSVLIGLNLSTTLARQRGLKNGLIADLMPILVLASVIGARIYYVTFEWRNYSGVNFWSSINLFGLSIPIPSAFEIWGGGIAIHGALIAGTISVILFCRYRKQPLWDVLDVLLPSVALGQAIGRWGNFFNNEAFGLPTNLPWKLFIPYIYRPSEFSASSYFHPTFLYESIWNLAIFSILIVLFKSGRRRLIRLPSGAIACLYLVTYSLGRLWIEGLRTDPLCLGSLPPFCEGGIRVAQIMSILLLSAGLIGLWWLYSHRGKTTESKRLSSDRSQ